MEEYFKKQIEQNKNVEERFINYCNKNYFSFKPLWRLLYYDRFRYSKLRKYLPIIITYSIFIGLIIFTITNTLFDSLIFFFNTTISKNLFAFIIGIINLSTIIITIYFTIKTLFKKINIPEKFKGTQLFHVKRIMKYWEGMSGFVFIIIISSISYWLNTDYPDHNEKWAFCMMLRLYVLFTPLIVLNLAKYALKEFYGTKIFPEYQKITYINCEYDDFLKGKLPNMNNPQIELNQILTTKLIPHPRNKDEKEMIQFINSNNEGLVFSIVNRDLSDKLRSNRFNKLTAEIDKIHEFGKLTIKLSRNFLVKDEEL